MNKRVVWSYSQRKAKAREIAIDWQSDYCNHNYSYMIERKTPCFSYGDISDKIL